MLTPDLVRSVLDSAPDAMLIIDGAGKIVFTNRQVSALFGYPAGELSGQAIECLLPERFRERHVGHRSSYIENVRVRPMGSGLDLFARRKDGSEFPVEISLSPASDGDKSLVVAAIRDTTERRRVQMELREARESADRANQAKSRFLATASHDLRQPVQALSLLNGTMRRMAPDATFAEALEQESEAIAAMSRLLNALLDISKLESGAIKPEVTDFRVASLFEELRREFATLAHAKGLALEVENSNGHIHSDPSLVGQVMRNFVSNAIKYTHRGGVRLRCVNEGSCARMEVCDTGIGMPDEELPRIFEDFYQVGVGSNASRDGYGLGLSIVARIAQLLGAKLSVTSRLGEGTSISITLPAAANDAVSRPAAPRPAARTTRPATQAHVLLVEDDSRVRNATRALLKVEGFEVSVAATLGEAKAHALSRSDIRLLVTDYHLGDGETGLQEVEAIRALRGRDFPAVMVTGDTSSAMRDLVTDDRLRTASKPINPDELMDVVKELLAP